ncbi:hypothetical protein [endosymbiont GvMRE of Glomus versiforme]|uniref:hypothetical protein n=1 Tax=endosymbiont GvMRE of Glomus versiforme TaxID=2039283 RepID=UPI000ED28E2E|nr:hypothetical protein [endosymbiont GvMRE of Glomus versiforme]RHZ37626.1 DNA-directed RNA polymerase subunit alpha [endosymbiont GvMRE of Glomus versiforme]
MNQELFPLPVMEIKKTTKNPLTTEFVFKHLEINLAATWGNTFRRLGNQVPGWAIFAVKISDKEKTIASEFGGEAILKGVKEIPSYLILNLMQLVFQSPKKDFSRLGEICTLQINIDNSQSKESYTVTGKDIKGDLKVINPEIYLATVEEHSELKIILHCRYYRGFLKKKEQEYLLSELSDKEKVIFLSSNYCPVKTVGWKTGWRAEPPVIVDLNNQEEKLILTITTNGSISAQDSLLMMINFLEKSMLNIRQLITSKPEKEQNREE